MIVLVDVAPVEDGVRDDVGAVVLQAESEQQAEQEVFVGAVDVDLAVLVEDLDRHIGDIGVNDHPAAIDVTRLQLGFGRE